MQHLLDVHGWMLAATANGPINGCGLDAEGSLQCSFHFHTALVVHSMAETGVSEAF